MKDLFQVHQIFGVIAILLSETYGQKAHSARSPEATYGLKAQPLLAQGNALGIQSRCDYALQGQKPNSCTCEVKLLRFQRDCSPSHIPRALPWTMSLLGFQPDKWYHSKCRMNRLYNQVFVMASCLNVWPYVT